jgi:hypothetical protein
MKLRVWAIALIAAAVALPFASVQASVLLYTQSFDNPVGFVSNGKDLDASSVNSLYGNQPAGFVFNQQFSVETLRVGGGQAFGVGYQDPQARAGRYVLGMLSNVQPDLIGLAFDVGSYDFLNFQFDLSSVDLDCCGAGAAGFVTPGAIPSARISLYDNPTGAAGLGSGPALDSVDVTGVAPQNKYTFNWTNHIVGLNAANSTNGRVIMRIDLLTGGYAALDNFAIAASNNSGEPPPTGVPEPGSVTLVILALAAATAVMRRQSRASLRPDKYAPPRFAHGAA